MIARIPHSISIWALAGVHTYVSGRNSFFHEEISGKAHWKKGPTKSRNHQKQSNPYRFYYCMHFIRKGVLKFYPIFHLNGKTSHYFSLFCTINQLLVCFILIKTCWDMIFNYLDDSLVCEFKHKDQHNLAPFKKYLEFSIPSLSLSQPVPECYWCSCLWLTQLSCRTKRCREGDSVPSTAAPLTPPTSLPAPSLQT